ncbi:MFS transporter [Natronobiforma cellulositropha]|uniref:MFS transporter n=1 Tax=Natronobiforma cellulositropha TaxID=1679076 RepID=UPI0021D5CF48|nr:MFS transporter [Natronobiforma cellulositropha]
MRRRTLWLGAAFFFVAGDAMAMQSRGALLSSFEETFGVSESLLGLVAPAGTVGFVLAILIVGLLAGRLRVKLAMALGTLVVIGALVATALAPVYALFLLALFAQGAGAGVFRALDRPVLSHVYPQRVGRIFVLYSLAWAVGAVTGPLLVSGVLWLTDWRVTYLLLALWFVPVVLLVSRLEFPSGWGETELDREALAGLLGRQEIRGAVLAMVLVGGIEGAIFTWLPYYAGTFLDRTLANAALSIYLLAYVPGRYLYARLVGTGAYLQIALVTTALAVPTVAVALVFSSGVAMVLAVFLTGMLVSSLFPMLSAYSVERAPAYSGPVSALTSASTYVGIALVPMVMGVVAEATDIAYAMWIPVFLTVALVVVIAVLYARER